jgi:hypothetical protein
MAMIMYRCAVLALAAAGLLAGPANAQQRAQVVSPRPGWEDYQQAVADGRGSEFIGHAIGMATVAVASAYYGPSAWSLAGKWTGRATRMRRRETT